MARIAWSVLAWPLARRVRMHLDGDLPRLSARSWRTSDGHHHHDHAGPRCRVSHISPGAVLTAVAILRRQSRRTIAGRCGRQGPGSPSPVGPGAEFENPPMKLIIAIIQPTKLEAVKEALSQVEVFRLTVMDVQGFGRQKGYTEVYRGHEFTVNLLRKIELQIAVNEDFVEPTVNAIIEAGRSGPDGKIGDGKIFILPLDDCIRIRTGERGPEAI